MYYDNGAFLQLDKDVYIRVSQIEAVYARTQGVVVREAGEAVVRTIAGREYVAPAGMTVESIATVLAGGTK